MCKLYGDTVMCLLVKGTLGLVVLQLFLCKPELDSEDRAQLLLGLQFSYTSLVSLF